MKTNFERGQLNAQDDLNANFIEIGQLIENSILPLVAIDGIEGQIGNLPNVNGKEVGVGNSVTYTNDNYKFISVNKTNHRIKIEEDGVYCFVMHAWVHPTSDHNGYFYINVAKDGLRIGGQDRLFSVGSGSLKFRQDGAGIFISQLAKGDEISALIETNYAGTLSSAGIKSVMVVKVA